MQMQSTLIATRSPDRRYLPGELQAAGMPDF
jgi:hypothetical protein